MDKIMRGELINLDHTIARFIFPRLVEFKKGMSSYPASMAMGEWDEILDKMIYAMGRQAEGSWNWAEDEDMERINEGMTLFAEHFNRLWW